MMQVYLLVIVLFIKIFSMHLIMDDVWKSVNSASEFSASEV